MAQTAAVTNKVDTLAVCKSIALQKYVEVSSISSKRVILQVRIQFDCKEYGGTNYDSVSCK
jgi:hypothetical protein